jgi:hypothetical protein
MPSLVLAGVVPSDGVPKVFALFSIALSTSTFAGPPLQPVAIVNPNPQTQIRQNTDSFLSMKINL